MRKIVEGKLNLIADIWNDFIWEYSFCNSQIKFTEDVKSNYFGDILHYFSDTFNVIFKKNKAKNFSGNFESSISFLQAIYIQQDFIEELLLIFRCNKTKGDLLLNDDYKINRDIRNELVGHPIRKDKVLNKNTNKKEMVLLSSSLFGNQLNSKQISYLRYHRDNSYKFEIITHLRIEILERHIKFLNCYFDIIIQKLQLILKSFYEKVEEIETVIEKADFNKIINLVSQSFESIFNLNPLYKPELLLEVFKKKQLHMRYDNALNFFMKDLKNSLREAKERIKRWEQITFSTAPKSKQNKKIEVIFVNNENIQTRHKETYHYEMGKLIDKRNYFEFQHFSGLLKAKCQDKPQVSEELDFMEANRENDLEYFSAYHLIKTLLKIE